MGWEVYIQSSLQFGTLKKNVPSVPISFTDEKLIKYLFWDDKLKTIYFIRELNTTEKQSSENLYKFVKYQFEGPVEESQEFKSNQELLKILIKYQSCKEIYQRHFKLIKLLK